MGEPGYAPPSGVTIIKHLLVEMMGFWTDDMKNYLKQVYAYESTASIAARLNTSESAIRIMACRMHLRKIPIEANGEILRSIKEMYAYRGAKEIAEELDISERYVYHIASQEKLKKDFELKKLKSKECRYIRENINRKSYKQMSRELNLCPSTISRLVKIMGVHPDKTLVNKRRGNTLRRKIGYETFLRESHLKPDMDRVIGYSPHRCYLIWQLRKRGYVLCTDEVTFLYTMGITNRSHVMERHAARKGFAFHEYPLPSVFEENEGTCVPKNKNNRHMEINGRIIEVLPVRQGTNSKGNQWQYQSYVLETAEEHPKTFLFEVAGYENIHKFNIQKDDRVKIMYDTQAIHYKDTWFGKNRAYDVVKE